MIALLLIPLALPFALLPLARRAVLQVRPEVALWAVTVTSAALAVGVVACLGVLLLPLALKVPAVAEWAEVVRPLEAGPHVVAVAVSALATGALAVSCVTGVRRATAEVRRFRAAHDHVAGAPEAGGLYVLDDSRPDAYALPGARLRSGRVVVTTGMLRALAPNEREALLAHERAHLAGRHHLFLAVAQLAGWCHPGLAAAVAHVSFAAERAADEAAAKASGDRTLTARAIGRAALAVTRDQERAPLPSFATGAAGGPVPARVKALFSQAPTRRLAPVLLAMVLVCGAAAVSSSVGAIWLHDGVEVAQGEDPSHCPVSLR
ncbi:MULTISPECIES: M56 family metallopeptidase [unclassified Streptomyces]|uniref:M56 family metallopeptidase n=1 Tax=unclassified Streptomyces TaxID=2593676 RepID=UPI0037F55170